MALRVALVGGPMYDHLYSVLDDDTEIVVHADHPTLNHEVANRLAAGERIDVLATHSKYAPSQQQWLRPLDGLIDTSGLAPLAVELCRPTGPQLCVPRLIDVRIMWARRDRLEDRLGGRLAERLATWTELVEHEVAFGFPGRESGLFGTFFELVVGAGGRLFDDAGRPELDTPAAIDAIAQLVALARSAPPDLPDWHYDQVDAALLDGRIDAAGVWPGGWGAIRDGELAEVLEPLPYPSGPRRWASYAGCHAWAIPTTCEDIDGAISLVQRLSGFDAQALDATGGSVCAHVGAFAAVEPVNPVDRRRLDITARTIEHAMITYPPHPNFPVVEDAGWAAINAVLRGTESAAAAVAALQQTALEALR